jgi:aconitase B
MLNISKTWDEIQAQVTQIKSVMLVQKGTMGVGSSKECQGDNVALDRKKASPYVPFINIKLIVRFCTNEFLTPRFS